MGGNGWWLACHFCSLACWLADLKAHLCVPLSKRRPAWF
jgi:hypothetical protein